MDWTEPARAAGRAPRLAASIIVLRDTPAGLEVLMQRRAEREGDQNGGACVFPGGALDAADRAAHALCRGTDDAAASARLGVPEGGLDFWCAAVRECFEEAGLLLLRGADSEPVDLVSRSTEEVTRWQHAVHGGELDVTALAQQLGATLATDDLRYWSHWLTPPGLARRFDTRFFVARAPARQQARADEAESAELLWLTPAQALDKQRRLKLLPVTRRTLAELQRFADVEAVLAEAARPGRVIELMMPRIGLGAHGPRPVLPDEWPYAEVARLDPEGRGDIGIELLPGRAVRLSERVVRVTAPNGSVMTGPGTNSYFVGDPARAAHEGWTLIDPGPDDAAHVRALLAAAPGHIARILVTHTHKDHSPAARAIHAATGAPLWGCVAAHPEWQDTDFAPHHMPAPGERLVLGPRTTLRAVHTPGHASNHVCWLLEEERLLFTGDHLMQGSTVVINPPDGDMAAYLASLRALLDEPLDWLAPGHGFLIDRPHDVVRKTIAHRLQREAKVLAGLQALGGEAAMAPLLAQVYADVPAPLHGVAERSLRAHLGKLVAEARVELRQAEGAAPVWRLASA